jgi:hypothetical protein
MSRVLISYRRADTEHIVGRIYDHLTREFGAKQVFKDVDSIPVGTDFRTQINNAVKSCHVVIVVIGPGWLNAADAKGKRRLEDPNDFVRLEIEAALGREIPLIPLLVAGATMPDSTALPDSIRELSFRHAIPIRPDPDFVRDARRLISSITEVLPRASGRSSNVLAAGAVVALVALAFWGFRLLQPPPGSTAATPVPPPATAETPATAADERRTIAVYPATRGPAAGNPSEHQFDLQEVTRRLEEALRATRRFRLFERDKQMQQAIFEEQDFAKSERARGNAAEFGKMFNVGLVVQPHISEFRFTASFTDMAGLPGKYRRTDSGKLVVVFKVLDTTTGELMYQVTSDAGFSAAAGVFDVKQGGPGPDFWIKMVDEVCNKGADAIVSTVYPPLVVEYTDNQVFIDRGDGSGLKVGDVLMLFAAGPPLTDDKGQNLGSRETLIGKIRVVRVAPKFSVAEPLGQLKQDPKRNDIVRRR